MEKYSIMEYFNLYLCHWKKAFSFWIKLQVMEYCYAIYMYI